MRGGPWHRGSGESTMFHTRSYLQCHSSAGAVEDKFTFSHVRVGRIPNNRMPPCANCPPKSIQRRSVLLGAIEVPLICMDTVHVPTENDFVVSIETSG